MLRILIVACLMCGCSARLGPHDDGWLSWDVCGYEGGVAFEITVMQAGARLGCTNPTESTIEDPITDPVTPVEPEPTP